LSELRKVMSAGQVNWDSGPAERPKKKQDLGKTPKNDSSVGEEKGNNETETSNLLPNSWA